MINELTLTAKRISRTHQLHEKLFKYTDDVFWLL